MGLLKNMELRLTGEFRSVQPPTPEGGSDTTISGVASMSVGTKIGITVEDGIIPETSFLLQLALPVGSENFRTQNVAPALYLAMRNSLSATANLYYNIGGVWDGTNGAGTGYYSVLGALSLSSSFSVFGEFYGYLATGVRPLHAADAGDAGSSPEPSTGPVRRRGHY